MASSDPIGDALALLYGVLSGDGTLSGYLTGGIHARMAPPGTAPDWLLLINQSAVDTNAAIAARILTRTKFQVKCVGPAGDESNLRTAYKRADALLQPSGLALRNTSGTLACWRESAFELPELVNGALWLNIGGFYYVEV